MTEKPRSETDERTPDARAPGKMWSLDDPDLGQVLRRMVHAVCPAWFDVDLRDEVFQEAFCRLAQRGVKSHFNSSFLWNTATNVKREKARKAGLARKREAALEVGDGADRPDEAWAVASAPTPEENARGRQLGRAIRDCLKLLRPERRQAVTLHLTGFKVPEIAAYLSWPLKSAENRVYRGLDQLRSCLTLKGVAP